ncbi:MAG: PHP domain-containing protein [Odoribacteraceae bacterium]|nr:PHP domain-containing protein [Odoribacteraceae bacterium]
MKADLHVHTVLSPCADLDMSPRAIVAAARERGIDALGITDHNSMKQLPVMRQVAGEAGMMLLQGVEVTTREEVHCLAFFPGETAVATFQRFLDERLPAIPNDPARFGYQVVVDADERVLEEEPRLLVSALDAGIDEVERLVHLLEGIFIPAHVDKSRDSILSQLGFIPPALVCDAIELSARANPALFIAANPLLHRYPVVRSSDAHYLPDVGKVFTRLTPVDRSFEAIRRAIRDASLS